MTAATDRFFDQLQTSTVGHPQNPKQDFGFDPLGELFPARDLAEKKCDDANS